MLISLFIKGWGWCIDTLIPFLWKYKSVVVISLLLLWVVVLKQDVKKEQYRVLEGVQSFEDYKKEQQEIY